jgi:exodeoxyribonuclease VII large subunit
MKAISVSELNNQIKSIVDSHFEIVYVKGEVSKVVYHNSGHLYFTLKDENSAINCAMWRNNVSRMKFTLKEGQKILVYGAVNVYSPRGEYKLIAQTITPSGIGELQLAFEELKKELASLGYFDEKNKKPLPKFPKRIAIITSRTAAALQDMIRIAKKRWLLSEFYLFNTLVQGENAAEDIALKIKLADEFVFEDGKGFDLIIVGRGGGSKEDLWAFNERVVADAIFRAKTPIISAVGHEIDYLISDFVADKRAATPSNAMEIALPDKNEILFFIDEMIESFKLRFLNILQEKERSLNHFKEIFNSSSPFKKLDSKLDEVKLLEKNFEMLIEDILRQKENELNNLFLYIFLVVECLFHK